MSWTKWTAAIQVTTGVNGERLTPTEKLVYVLLANYFNDKEGWAFPAVATLARQAQLQRRQCQAVLASLEMKGLVRRIAYVDPQWGQRQNRYDGILPAARDETPPVQPGTPPHAVDCTPPCSGMHPPRAADCMGGCGEERPGDALECIAPVQPTAPKQIEEPKDQPEDEDKDELAALPPRINEFRPGVGDPEGPTPLRSEVARTTAAAMPPAVGEPALGPVTHGERVRLRYEYDQEKRALAEKLDPTSQQRGLRLAEERMGGFDQWLARKQGIGG